MWAMECKRTANTITWFPHHVTLPIASSVNLVLAGARDIARSLKHPSPSSLLDPLSDSKVATLTTISDIPSHADADANANANANNQPNCSLCAWAHALTHTTPAVASAPPPVAAPAHAVAHAPAPTVAYAPAPASTVPAHGPLPPSGQQLPAALAAMAPNTLLHQF
jgi:hypothetical protein